ncbi:Pentatricopeptide repeat-containing protein, mitochondrial [Vitis vinifera]|uniref:Pentatricopeptide repeat-containing protein, mitochondrial n=1 Tax=Vitis vinifera TaxID=29760 RepID=A0A438H919_VITVI|nr:Pentatricopeptide repeat-containing protein, mitochondrial [Vitis vinifera]
MCAAITAASAASVLDCRMLQSFFNAHLHKPHIKRVGSLFSHLIVSTTKSRFFISSLADHSSQSSSSSSVNEEAIKTHVDLSAIDCSRIVKSVILRCSHLWETNSVKPFGYSSLKEHLLGISDISPETTRKFRRVSELKPEDVLEILLGFQFHRENPQIESGKVESLWGIFKWSNDQNKGFKHLPQSCEIMASMLIRVGLLREVESLLAEMESRGVLLDGHEIFSNLVEGYVCVSESERAISVYDQMRGRGLVPSLSCYNVLIDHLVQTNEKQLVFRVYLDMVEMGFDLSNAEMANLENVIRLLCRDGKIQEGRSLVKKVTGLGLNPSSLILDEIANGYREKKDFEDALSFFVEMNCAPSVVVGNKIMYSLCRDFGTERADLFLQELEHLGFSPDEITFGILISWCCREGKLKNAFIYLSEILSRDLKPDICSYNAIISGVFKEGLWKHAQDILHEMVDMGIKPDLLTFRVLLAGYCKARRFDEAKATVGEMVNYGLIQLCSQEDLLSKAFMVLELDPLAIRVKRDNDVGFSKTEFFDNLGNGLYLETDVDEYEKKVTGILEDSMVPDFNLLITRSCAGGNVKTAMMVVDEMVRWGQELSLSAFSALLEGLCASRFSIKAVTGLLEKMPKLVNQVDEETLNLLVQTHCKKGFIGKGKIILNGMLQRHLSVKSETYVALLAGLCKKGNSRTIRCCWDLARRDKWLLELKDCKVLVGCLCQQKFLKEALELLESMLATYPHFRLDVCNMFLEKLCVVGFTSIAHALVDEFLQQGCILDHTAHSHLISGFCKEKRFSEAFTIFESMQAKNLVPCLDASILLIPQLCRANRVEKAIALKDLSLREQSIDSFSVHSALMNGFCKTGRIGEAAILFQDMFSNGLLPDIEICNMLVFGYCQANSVRKVTELIGVMIRKDLGFSISVYRNVVRLLCMNGMVLPLLRMKELMLRENNFPHLIVYNILIYHLFQTGNSLLVKVILGELHKKGLLFDEVTYNFLVYGFLQSKDVPTSVQYLTAMISKELRPSSRNLRAVISCLCDSGMLRKALELSREMELRGWIHGSIAQNAIVGCLLSHGKLKEAESFLDRMVEKGLIPDNINYESLIRQFCWHGRLNKAVELLNIMLKKGNLPNCSSYDSVIQGFCTVDRLDEAMDFHTEMLDRKLRPSIKTWDALAHKFCQDGRTAEAESLLVSMVQMGETPTREMYTSLINRLRSENNLSKASELLQAMQLSGHAPDFGTHWSLISNLNRSKDKDSANRGFLSRLLSESGFSRGKSSKQG